MPNYEQRQSEMVLTRLSALVLAGLAAVAGVSGTALAESLRQRPGMEKPKPVTDAEIEGDAKTEDKARAEDERVRPGVKRKPLNPYDVPGIDPNAGMGLDPIPLPPPNDPSNFVPIPDRWRLINTLGLVKERWYDPYNRNILKADRPLFDDWFVNLSFISDTVLEPRRLPTPTAPVTSAGPGVVNVFGATDQFLFNQNFIPAIVLIKGDTIFRPPDLEFHLTPVFNINHTQVDEQRLLNIDPRRGTTRDVGFIGMQELFFDIHLQNVSDRYDFDSYRFGIQPFSTDFRGFLFQDSQLGFRLFGQRDNNIWQYNLAWFRRLEKDTNSGLNSLTKDLREDDIFVANVYRQDFPVRGHTSQLIAAYNRNREGDQPFFFDKNGFLARPASLGLQKPRNYDVVYLGFNGDGHFGRLNLTSSFYYAIGDESRGVFQDESSEVRAWFAAAEASVDYDWVRVRASLVHGSGDSDPFDRKSEGFDAILENPQIAGSDTSFYIRQGIPLIGGGGVALSGRNGVLNSFRSSIIQGQSNFTNPGVQLYGIGADFDVLPELRISANFNKVFFDNTAVLEVARNQGPIDTDIGWDLSTAVIYRPHFTQNVVMRLSGAMLVPGKGFQQLFVDEVSYSVLGNLILTY